MKVSQPRTAYMSVSGKTARKRRPSATAPATNGTEARIAHALPSAMASPRTTALSTCAMVDEPNQCKLDAQARLTRWSAAIALLAERQSMRTRRVAQAAQMSKPPLARPRAARNLEIWASD